MWKILLSGLILLFPSILKAKVLVLPINYWGKLPNIEWNGSTPLAVNHKENLTLTALIDGKEIEFSRELTTNLDQILYSFTPKTPLTNQENFLIKVQDHQNKFGNKSYKIKVKRKITTPILEILSISDSVTHGGSGLVVVKSESVKNLHFLGIIDEKNIPFYPKTFIKDGYYVILFPWYSDYSHKLCRQYILAIDNAGNTNTLALNTKAKLRDYVKKTINLPNNYASQKAKELSLSQEDAKKLEGNINEINKALASTKSVDRWKLTRSKSFQNSIKKVVSNNMFFSDPMTPFPNAYTTATYGDQRRYYYKKKVVRTSIHRGLDLANKKNSPIFALMDGTVVYADWNSGNGKSIY
ncbi:MAG: M23 family metallopeptidase, partial [Brevinema sp.]